MSSDSKPIVLVTGGTGYLGSHIVDQLLNAGYTVRATIRSAKTASFKATYPNAGDKLQIVEIADIATGDFTEAFKGVGALIHTAAPIFTGNLTGDEILQGAFNGALNVVAAAVKARVPKIIYTSTIGTLFDTDFKNIFGKEPINETTWPRISLEDVDTKTWSTEFVYLASKALAEKKFWEVAGENPDLDFTAVLPPSIYGPWIEHYPPPADRSYIGTNDIIYALIAGGPDGPNTYPKLANAYWGHVVNVARAHLAALNAPPHKEGKEKRLIIIEGEFRWPEAVELLKQERPELINRLPDSKHSSPPAQSTASLDPRLTIEVLGKEAFTGATWQKTVLETIDALVEWEKKH